MLERNTENDRFIIDTFRLAPMPFDVSESINKTRTISTVIAEEVFFKKVCETFAEKSFKSFNNTSTVPVEFVSSNCNIWKTKVSISNFTILNFNYLYPKAIIEIYNDESYWSHPYVFYFLKYFQELRRSLIINECIEEKDTTYKMKVFVNMCLTMIGRNAGFKSGLYIKNGNNIYREIYQKANEIMIGVIDKLDITDRVVCYYKDQIVFTGKCIIPKKSIEGGVLEYISIEEPVTEISTLNKICRKLEIDIVI